MPRIWTLELPHLTWDFETLRRLGYLSAVILRFHIPDSFCEYLAEWLHCFHEFSNTNTPQCEIFVKKAMWQVWTFTHSHQWFPMAGGPMACCWPQLNNISDFWLPSLPTPDKKIYLHGRHQTADLNQHSQMRCCILMLELAGRQSESYIYWLENR